MTESEEKFKMLVKSSLEQAKEVFKIRVSKENLDNMADRVLVNLKNYIEERYCEK